MTAVKYILDHRKPRYELVDEPNNQLSRIFICRVLATTVIKRKVNLNEKVCKLNIVC